MSDNNISISIWGPTTVGHSSIGYQFYYFIKLLIYYLIDGLLNFNSSYNDNSDYNY